MKAVWSWLLELVELPVTPDPSEAARRLTAAGLEIEGLTNTGDGFAGVVVAEVVAKRPHPDAAKLTLVDVITERGGAATQVVCGAGNVPEPGGKVLWAQPGARLPGGITIAAKAVKGITSPGMLCSEIELGVGDDDSGIVVFGRDDEAPLGAPAQRALWVDDWVLDVNVPANRPDCLGHLGLARELAAIYRGRLTPPAPLLAEVTGDFAGKVAVVVEDAAGCPRYVARIIDGVTVKPSPRRYAQRLRAVGVRPLSNLVDATNYVMFELGQPLHAFDDRKVPGGIIVRTASAGERTRSLDGIERELAAGDLVIADGQRRAVAIAGVMGGAGSEVSADTTRVLLESAAFEPRRIRRAARRLGLHSESSHRFERGPDRNLVELASRRCADLIARWGGGRVGRESVDVGGAAPSPSAIAVRLAWLRKVSGVDDLAAETCQHLLEGLGFAVAARPSGDLEVTPPSPRGDVTREADVVEEVLRQVGYDAIPATLPALRQAPLPAIEARPDRVRRHLAGLGLDEAITFAFQSRARLEALRLAADDVRAQPIALRNPMSAEQAVMRTSLVPNLLAAVARNIKFGVADVAIFEVGSVFWRAAPGEGEPGSLGPEPSFVCGLLCGAAPRWLGERRAWDFFDAKGLVEGLFSALGGPSAELAFSAATESFLHPGLAAAIEHRGRRLGWVGELHPATRRALGVDVPVFAFELAIDALPTAAAQQMTPIPRFPASTRDLSVLVAEEVAAASIGAGITGAGQALLEGAFLVEEYRGQGVPPGKKSMLWALSYRSLERTLTDVEVDQAHEAIVASLASGLGAVRR